MLLNCGVGEDSESPLDCKEIQPVHPKRNESWILIGRTNAEAEAPILWPPDAKSRLIRKDPDAGNDWRQEEKGTAEDKMDEWHHQLDGHKDEQALGDGEGQGSLACCSPWGHKASDTTEQLKNIEQKDWKITGKSQQMDIKLISSDLTCLKMQYQQIRRNRMG